MPTTKHVTPDQVAAAVKALGLTIPVRSAFWKGTQIILRTRNGDHAWTPPGSKKKPASKVSA